MNPNLNMESILVHIHIFKNAGTSLDVILKNHFQDRFLNYDKNDPEGYISVNETAHLVQANPNVACIASHQIYLPLPVFQTKFIIPIFYLRHPIARVQSCFHFERDIQKNYSEDTTLEVYVKRLLEDTKVNAIVNLQTAMLCDSRFIYQDRSKERIDQRVLNTALNHLNAYNFGIVEHFKESLTLLETKLDPFIGGIKLRNEESEKVHVNSTINKDLNLQDKIKYVKNNLSKETYNDLLEQLMPDIKLYNHGLGLFEKRYGQLKLNGY